MKFHGWKLKQQSMKLHGKLTTCFVVRSLSSFLATLFRRLAWGLQLTHSNQQTKDTRDSTPPGKTLTSAPSMARAQGTSRVKGACGCGCGRRTSGRQRVERCGCPGRRVGRRASCEEEAPETAEVRGARLDQTLRASSDAMGRNTSRSCATRHSQSQWQRKEAPCGLSKKFWTWRALPNAPDLETDLGNALPSLQKVFKTSCKSHLHLQSPRTFAPARSSPGSPWGSCPALRARQSHWPAAPH